MLAGGHDAMMMHGTAWFGSAATKKGPDGVSEDS
jgi:hypothetical protein